MNVILPSYITAHTKVSGFGTTDLSANSIIVDDDGVSFLIGEDARKQSWDSTRMHGGHFGVPQYRNLVRALVAKILGPGEHERTVALAASHLWVDEIRVHQRSDLLKEEQKEFLRETVSSIKFKTSVDSDWKYCSLKIVDEPRVYHELNAVSFVLPRDKYRNYVLWQLGHGDLQQIAFVDGEPVLETITRSEGLHFAIKNLGEQLGITSPSLAEQAWLKEYTQASGEMNGKTIPCTEEKVRATRAYFNQQVLGKALNIVQPYKHKANNVILSAGGAEDATFLKTLSAEVQKFGYSFWPIHQLKGMEYLDESQRERLISPRFTAVKGLKTRADLALDIGNSALKGEG